MSEDKVIGTIEVGGDRVPLVETDRLVEEDAKAQKCGHPYCSMAAVAGKPFCSEECAVDAARCRTVLANGTEPERDVTADDNMAVIRGDEPEIDEPEEPPRESLRLSGGQAVELHGALMRQSQAAAFVEETVAKLVADHGKEGAGWTLEIDKLGEYVLSRPSE